MPTVTRRLTLGLTTYKKSSVRASHSECEYIYGPFQKNPLQGFPEIRTWNLKQVKVTFDFTRITEG